MSTKSELVSMGLEWLEFSPPHPTVPPPADLRGFEGPIGFICSTCTGRMTGRGVNWTKLASKAVWADENNLAMRCELCGERKD